MSEDDTTLGSVLVVATDRDDRRVLFDALDGESFDAVYTAKDHAQGLAFVEQGTPVDLCVVEFAASGAEGLHLCRQIRQFRDRVAIKILGIASPDAAARSHPETMAMVASWIDSPVSGVAALEAIRGLLATDAEAPGDADRDPFRTIFEQSPDEQILADPRSGLVIDVNMRVEEITGVPRSKLRGMPLSALGIGLDAGQWRRYRASLGAEGKVSLSTQRRRADGRMLPVELLATLSEFEGALVDQITLRDRVEVEALRMAMRLASEPMDRYSDDPAGHAGVIDALLHWLGVDLLMVVERPTSQNDEPRLRLLLVTEDLPKVSMAAHLQPTLQQVLDGGKRQLSAGAWRELADDLYVQAQRLESWMGFALHAEEDELVGALVLAGRTPYLAKPASSDVIALLVAQAGTRIELRRLRALSRLQGLHDTLTGLPNRLLFNDRMESAINEARRTGEMFAVLFVDLDRFKTINDSLGHGVGDQLLSAVARRLRANVRSSDTVARYAGDEFTLVLRHIIQREDAIRIAEKIGRALETPVAIPEIGDLQVTASIGVAYFPDDGGDTEILLKHADLAMYGAKGMGRNVVQAYVAAPGEPAQQHVSLEAKLRTAERNGELRVFYQPQLEVESEDIVGMEALIRWEHPDLGMVSPGMFIPIAEDSGLIVSIGEWVLKTACRDTVRWCEQFNMPLKIGVNLSALQLKQPNLVEIVAAALADTGLPPAQLDLEVTESISIKSIPNLMETLHGVRALGCSISIDDFGTGQSSLDYIKRFPADRIKIDQSFVRNIGVDPDDEAIVRATISMAHNMHLSVVAEGVEIEDHLEFLRQAGCEEVQGFLFCRPLPPSSFEALMQERERLLIAAGLLEARAR